MGNHAEYRNVTLIISTVSTTDFECKRSASSCPSMRRVENAPQLFKTSVDSAVMNAEKKFRAMGDLSYDQRLNATYISGSMV